MASVSASNTVEIFDGQAATTTDTVTFLGLESAGDTDAPHILTHPNTELAPIVYESNPTRIYNMDNDALRPPFAQATVTLSSTHVTKFSRGVDDVIVTEIWEGSRNLSNMITAFWRSLYEYILNEPDAGEFITYQPRSRNSRTYQVRLLDLTAGGSPEALDLLDLREKGGSEIDGALANVTTVTTGLVDVEVRLRMVLVAEVTS